MQWYLSAPVGFIGSSQGLFIKNQTELTNSVKHSQLISRLIKNLSSFENRLKSVATHRHKVPQHVCERALGRLLRQHLMESGELLGADLSVEDHDRHICFIEARVSVIVLEQVGPGPGNMVEKDEDAERTE